MNTKLTHVKQYMTLKASNNYDNWSKEELIKKILDLEKDQKKKFECSETFEVKNPNVNIELSKEKKKNVVNTTFKTRFIALKLSYLGWNFSGMSYQKEKTDFPTIEGEILKVLKRSNLISDVDLDCCNFNRCGRTDKGVSSLNQVISLSLRSSLKKEEQLLKENDKKEIPYLKILNTLLPPEIRINQICLRPPENFNARFSCKYRHYRYVFSKNGLDIDLMKISANKFEGTHDFRNFCKIDKEKKDKNFVRKIISSNIIPFVGDLYFFDLKGTAFLWNQVRNMMSILFLIGQKQEDISIIDHLLDVEKFKHKPNYEKAWGVPLILYDCAYEEMEWLNQHEIETKSYIGKSHSVFKKYLFESNIKSTLIDITNSLIQKNSLPINTSERININLGDGIGRNVHKYVTILEKYKMFNDTAL